MNIDALTRILDTRFNGRVWQIAASPFEGSIPLAGFHVRPVAGQTVPAEADVLALEADDTARQDASISAVQVVRAKTEARRRILAFLPEWKQANLTARAVELTDIGRANWTAEQAAEWDAGAALWTRVKAIRAASDAIEVRADLATINVTDNQYWPE